MRAAAAGLLDVIELLYECSFNWVINYPLEVDKIDFLGSTALSKAAQHGHLIVVKYLVEVLDARVEMVDYDVRHEYTREKQRKQYKHTRRSQLHFICISSPHSFSLFHCFFFVAPSLFLSVCVRVGVR